MLVYKIEIRQGLKNCYPVIPDSYKFSCRAKISFSFAQWVTAGQLSSNKIKKKSSGVQGKQNLRAAFPKGKLEFKFFFQALLRAILYQMENFVFIIRFIIQISKIHVVG